MTSRRVSTIAIAAIAAIALAACGGESEEGDTTLPEITLLTTTTEAPLFEESDGEVASASTLAASDESTTTIGETAAPTTLAADVVTTSVAAPVSADTTTTAPAPAAGGFVLGPDGLGAVPFGAEPEQTITFVTSAFGAPTLDTGWVDPFDIGPCGGTRIRQVSWNQLQLEFGDVSNVSEGRDHFYAYFYGVEGSSTPQPAGLQTAEKIGAGSSVAELLSAYPEVKLLMGDEFIGPSFFVNDNLAGRMSGVTDADVVEAVIGGRPCDG